MKARKILAIVFGIIALAIDIFIIVESFMDGNNSGSQSLGFTNFLISVLEKMFPGAAFLEDKDHLHAVIRKVFGHFLLFGLSGVFTTLSLLLFNREDTKKRMLIFGSVSLGSGLILASISELIQYFIPGRAGMLTDILIDFSGFLLFALITFGILLLVFRKTNKETLSH